MTETLDGWPTGALLVVLQSKLAEHDLWWKICPSQAVDTVGTLCAIRVLFGGGQKSDSKAVELAVSSNILKAI